VIERHRLDLANWSAKRLDIYRIGSQKVTPYQNFHRAATLERLDLDDAAVEELNEALKISPNYLEPYKLRGRIYAKREDYEKAFADFRVAVVFDPWDKGGRHDFAAVYYKLGKYGYAIEQYHKILERWPRDPRAYYGLAKSYAQVDSRDDAAHFLQLAYQFDSENAEEAIETGDIFFERGHHTQAVDAYSLAIHNEKHRAEAHAKLGVVYREAGDRLRAREEWEKALEFDPENEEIKKNLQELTGAEI
jgi:Flp pilus assembly protein TadD